jgi:CHASE2 domain-containing sensor protein
MMRPAFRSVALSADEVRAFDALFRDKIIVIGASATGSSGSGRSHRHARQIDE